MNKEYRKQYYNKNKEYILRRQRVYYQHNKKKIIEYNRRYWHEWLKDPKNRQKLNTSMRKYSKRRTQEKRVEIITLLGSKCKRCGFSDKRALQLDHINGGGRKEVEKFGSTNDMIMYYLKHQDIISKHLQLLCANCNWIKIDENQELYKKTLKTP